MTTNNPVSGSAGVGGSNGTANGSGYASASSVAALAREIEVMRGELGELLAIPGRLDELAGLVAQPAMLAWRKICTARPRSIGVIRAASSRALVVTSVLLGVQNDELRITSIASVRRSGSTVVARILINWSASSVRAATARAWAATSSRVSRCSPALVNAAA
jgi:hypothetical protein